MQEIRTILCPVDFSKASDHALSYAHDLAKLLNANLHIVYVWQPLLYAMGDGVIIPAGEFISQLLSELNDKLNRLTTQYQEQGIKVTSELVEGVPYEGIVNIAQKHPAELIVMGTHGRTGFTHFMVGSVTERVVRISPVPVLTVRGTTI
jgi:nucleotide-binding universal stress UspA family protein